MAVLYRASGIILLFVVCDSLARRMRNGTRYVPSLACPAGCSCAYGCGGLGAGSSRSRGLKCNRIDSLRGTVFARIAGDVCSLDISHAGVVSTPDGLFGKLTRLQKLRLSYNNITVLRTRAFRHLVALQELYLDHNHITKIARAAFEGLVRLRLLDVRHNKLKTWQGVLSKDLPALQQLHVWGNPGFVMRKDLLRRTTAQLITGTITTRCVDCSLRRVNNISREFLLDIVLSTYRGCVYYPKEHYQQLDSTRKKMVYFNGFCKRHNCTLSLTSLTPVKMLRQNRCLRAFRKLRPVVYTLGLCAMGLNLVVFTVIVCMKYLRSSVAFLLIAHLSLCDFLIGVYAIGAAVGNGSATSMVASKFYRLNICPYFWMIFVLGQFLSALTCLLVTVERYMTIVNCMKPHLRLTRSLASILLPASWVAALALGVPLERYDTRKISGTIMCIMVRNFMPEKGVLLSQCLMILFLFVYIVVVSLYIHIYIAAKKSCTQSGRSKRESRLARRIGLITLSNFVFFAVPNIAMFTFATNYISLHGNDVIDALIRRWVPPMCLVFNACVNPCLFAFGNRKFTTGARHCAQRMRNKALALLQQQPNI